MHFPVAIGLWGQEILLHLLFELFGFFTGYRYYLYLRKKSLDKISSSNRISILIGATLGALLGSRLAGALENPHLWMQAQNKLAYLYANKTVLGGLLGGLWGVEAVKLLIGEKNSSGNLFTYPIILAMMIGRIGCFSMGVYEETYGNTTSFFTGINLGDGLLRHPVALYEIGFLAILWWGLKKTSNSLKLADGAIFKLFMICYCIFRFLLDFIKPHYNWPVGLSTIQLTALLGLIYYALIIKKKSLIVT